MKKYFFIIASALAVFALASCEKDKYGTLPGNDTKPHAFIKVMGAALPNDPDCDAVVRIAANSATQEVYLFAETETAKDARGMSDEAYADYVVANGTKVALSTNTFDGAQGADILMPKLFGSNVVSAVAVGANGKSIVYGEYTGIKWNTVAMGKHKYGSSAIYNNLPTPGQYKEGVLLQQSDDDKTLFRLKDLYREGVHLQFRTYPDYVGEDEDGKYVFCRVPAQATSLTHPSYGAMSIRDMGYRYGDDSYIFEGGYEVGMYADFSTFLCMSVYVSAGNFGAAYDVFTPTSYPTN